jgi:hypothetical protein
MEAKLREFDRGREERIAREKAAEAVPYTPTPSAIKQQPARSRQPALNPGANALTAADPGTDFDLAPEDEANAPSVPLHLQLTDHLVPQATEAASHFPDLFVSTRNKSGFLGWLLLAAAYSHSDVSGCRTGLQGAARHRICTG